MTTVSLHDGDREDLRPLFELADDSPTALASYLNAGRVLVARDGAEIVGHLLVVGDEIVNMAVLPERQGRGVGAQLVRAALALLAADGVRTARVATAAASPGTLRFYQRMGFRMRSIERDAFTEATGYPPGLEIDGVPLRDRVWLDQEIAR